MPLRILHVLDHSIPLHSGYTFRTRAILREQAKLGWQTFHLTSPKQGRTEALREEVDGLTFYRCPPQEGFISRVPGLGQMALVSALSRRLLEVAEEVRPDILHAHSPSLNGLAAVRVGRAMHLPVVYEVRAFWEDAAVDHGTAREWGLRYRLTRASETRVLRRANAITTICNGLREEMITRGIRPSKITQIPNAVDIEAFNPSDAPDAALQAELGLQGKTVLGFLGSFYAYEGLDLLLDAMPQLLAANPDFRVLLVGGGPQEQALKAQAERLGLNGRGALRGARAAQPGGPLLQPGRYPGVPAPLDAPHRPGHAAEALGSDGAAQAGGGLRRGRAQGTDSRPRDGLPVPRGGCGVAGGDGAGVARAPRCVAGDQGCGAGVRGEPSATGARASPITGACMARSS